MKKSFITKLETNNYLIGSFDSYIEESKELLSKNKSISLEEVNELLKKMPTTTRAAIVNKKTGEYVGFIGISSADGINQSAELFVETNKTIENDDLKEIYKVFGEYLESSLNIHKINRINDWVNKRNSNSIVIPSRFLGGAPTDKQIEIVKNWGLNVPRLSYACAIFLDKVKFMGIIGLSQYNTANKRANLNVFLDPNLDDDLRLGVGAMVVNEYLELAHELNVHNIAASTSNSSPDRLLYSISKMHHFAEIPYTESNNGKLESRLLFQDVSGKVIGSNNTIIHPSIKDNLPEISELSSKIKLDDNYTLVRPSSFESEGIDLNHIIDGHIEAMQDREHFTIPLGEDKYFLQRGNDKYGITKSVSNFSYVIVDNLGNYVGYVNILRSEGRHVEIEIGVSPKVQAKGIGRKSLEAFYKELFRVGYASITSCVFNFNTPSIKLHDKVAEFNGVRIESYYANNKLWDMNYYTAVNPTLEDNTKSR